MKSFGAVAASGDAMKYIDQHCTCRKKKLSQAIEMRRCDEVDNDSKHTLNDYWDDERKASVTEEWIGTARLQILRINLYRTIYMGERSTHKRPNYYTT